MKKAVYKVKDEYRCFNSKATRRKEFFVDPARVQLDEYMLKQIKKNKRSVKSLSKQVVALKKKVQHLQDQHDDYMLLEKTRAPEYSQSNLAFFKQKSQKRIALTQQRSQEKVSRSRNHSKDSSLLSVSSSAKSFSSSKNYSSKTKKSKKSDVQSSKTRLSRKIQELKTKALLQESEKEILKKEVKKKISMALEKRVDTPTQDVHKEEQPLDEEYQRLIELLKTSKTIKSPSSTKKDSPKITQFKYHPAVQRKESLIIEEEEEEKVMPQKIRSIDSIPLKSTRTMEEPYQVRPDNYTEDNLKSETNLLESSPSRTPQQSPKRPRKPLQMSRAVEVRIVNQHQSQGTQGSAGFQGLFGSPALQVRSGTVEMSFQAGDSSRRRLRELQFEFDQLVRQQLIASDPKEKQILSRTIRSVLFSINELKGKLSKDSRDSG